MGAHEEEVFLKVTEVKGNVWGSDVSVCIKDQMPRVLKNGDWYRGRSYAILGARPSVTVGIFFNGEKRTTRK